ncbi:MAG: hypothetical protein D6772_05790, partial [Bacteroidetes bacterium]
MKLYKMRYLIIAFLLGLACLQAQDDYPKLYLNGYVKQLQSGNFFNEAFPDLRQGKLVDTFLLDNFLHHRLNVDWQLGGGWSVQGGLRTRFFYGEVVKANPLYAEQIDQGSNDWLKASSIWLDNNSLVGHSVIDRLYGEYTQDAWEIRLGRQRVNWGISTI